MHRINFEALKKTVAGAMTSAAHGARDLAFDAKEALERALVAKCLRPYVVKEQTATSGPDGLWKIYTAEYKTHGSGHYPSVSVWILEKKQLQDAARTKSRMWDPFLEQQKAGAGHLIRLKHPGILRIIEPLEETRTQFVMVSEPIFCSLSDWMTYFTAIPEIAESIRDVSFSELEIKHGLLQIAGAIGFLHTDANLAHRLVSPESVLVCADGHWALANMGLSTQIDFTGSKTISSYDYSFDRPSVEEVISKPRLEYVAPELVTARGEDMSVTVTPAVDVFSFGQLMHACLTRVALFCGVEQDIDKYRSKIATLPQKDLSTLPTSLQPFMRKTLSADPSSRPNISAVSTSPYFQDDVLLRALLFLEGMVGKDPIQRASFLKDLDKFWSKFDVRVIRYKVLPPLMQELQNPSLQSLAIPFVFKAAGNQEKEEFETHTYPRLKAVLNNVNDDGLFVVFTNCDALTKVMTHGMIVETLLPVFIRAFDQKAPKIQEEALRTIQFILECIDYKQLKTKILPRIRDMSMKTVSVKVRINCLVLMSSLASRLDKEEAQKMLGTCGEIVQVDKSPGTLMCALGLGDSISKFWGEEITAQTVLPFLSPLMISKTLSNQQFSTFLTVLRGMIARIEEKVGKQIRSKEPVNSESSTKADSHETNTNWDTERPKEEVWGDGLMMNAAVGNGLPHQPAPFPMKPSPGVTPTAMSQQSAGMSIPSTHEDLFADRPTNGIGCMGLSGQFLSTPNSVPQNPTATTDGLSAHPSLAPISKPLSAMNGQLSTAQPSMFTAPISMSGKQFMRPPVVSHTQTPMNEPFFIPPTPALMNGQSLSLPSPPPSMFNGPTHPRSTRIAQPVLSGLYSRGMSSGGVTKQGSAGASMDLLSGLEISDTKPVNHSTSQSAMSQDPFLTITCTQTPKATNDPFADLL